MPAAIASPTPPPRSHRTASHCARTSRDVVRRCNFLDRYRSSIRPALGHFRTAPSGNRPLSDRGPRKTARQARLTQLSDWHTTWFALAVAGLTHQVALHAAPSHFDSNAAPNHQRRRPEATALHRVVREHRATLFAEAAARSASRRGYPRFVVKEFAEYGANQRTLGAGTI